VGDGEGNVVDYLELEKIARPRQVYLGARGRKHAAINKR